MTMQLADLAKQTYAALIAKKLMLTTAESCTGGGVSYWLTSIAGSSQCFERGFVTYSNAAKIEMLDVSPITIEKFGAVSEETAREMAKGAINNSKADISLAITGIAGPSGGTPQKPVGTVWISIASRDQFLHVADYLFSGDRQSIRDLAIEQALQKLIAIIS